MASATEAELGALFMNAQEAVGLRNCLEAMGYPQPATALKTDNSTACGILNNTMKQKRSKAIDVRFYWLRDRAKQGQFYIYWDSGKNNFADFHTKKHPPTYHRVNRPIQTYIEGLSPDSLQGCIEMMNSVPSPKGLKQTGGIASTTDKVLDGLAGILERSDTSVGHSLASIILTISDKGLRNSKVNEQVNRLCELIL